jgi:hypothetical protein
MTNPADEIGQLGEEELPRLATYRCSQAGCPSLHNSHVLANATGMGCDYSGDTLTSGRTHMSGGIHRVLEGIELPVEVQRRRCS